METAVSLGKRSQATAGTLVPSHWDHLLQLYGHSDLQICDQRPATPFLQATGTPVRHTEDINNAMF